ncbi:MAG: hypothetical protein E7062_04200 [Spirochaetaceae bacterium]|nr:hypothetical protein [Spirochaetaceae bacterium]
MKKKIICCLLLCIASFALYSENFRVHALHKIIYDEKIALQTVSMGFNDALYIQLPKDISLVKALSFEIKIPKAVALYRDSVAYSFYNNIKPTPSATIIDYYGERISINTFPSRLSYNIQIPIRKDAKLKENPYTAVLNYTDSFKSELFFRLQLVMKGIVDDFKADDFIVTVTPIYADEGILEVSVIEPVPEDEKSENNYIIQIDDKPVSFEKGGIILPTGEHFVSVLSEKYRNEMRKVYINQGESSFLEISLKDVAPELTVFAPDSVEVFLDDVKIDSINEPFVVSEGNHVVKFLLGNYETIKTFRAEKSTSYSLSFQIDVQLIEQK